MKEYLIEISFLYIEITEKCAIKYLFTEYQLKNK